MTDKSFQQELSEALASKPGAFSTNIFNGPAPNQPSPTVLRLDKWLMRRGTEIAAEDEDQVAVMADMNGLAWLPDWEYASDPADRLRRAWIDDLTERTDFRELKRHTTLNSGLSEIAALQFASAWSEYDRQSEPPQDGDPAPGSDDESVDEVFDRIDSTTSALKSAKESVNQAVAMSEAIGCGDGAGGTFDRDRLMQNFQRMRGNQTLRSVFELAGRMITVCRSLQKHKRQHGSDDMVGVTLSGDVTRAVKRELANMACGIDAVEMMSMLRLANRSLRSREYRAIEPVGRGPIVACIDESGSMSGNEIEYAKAIGVTLAWLARQQNRRCVLASFCENLVGDPVIIDPRIPNDDALFAWITQFEDGGTELTGPLKQIPALWDSYRMSAGQTDHIVISDAVVKLPDALRDSYNAWQATNQVTTYSILIGENFSGADTLKAFSKHVWQVPTTLNNDALLTVLSI